MRRLTLAALLLTSLGITAAPAAALEKTVGFHPTDYIFIPERVAVKVGDSVKWSNTVSAEQHNVRFDDGQFTQPPLPSSNRFTTAPRTFSADGVYRYFCEIHGRDMSGVVYVNATATVPPNAQVRVTPNPASAGQAVTFNATATRAGDNPIAKYQWDLNGDGLYERDTGTTATTSETYMAAQELTARLKVTDSLGISEVRELPVTIEAPPPTPQPQPQPAPQPQPGPALQLGPAPAPTPQPQPAPQVSSSTGTTPSAPAARTFAFSAASTASRIKGAAVKVTCSGRCRITATLSISKSVARKARLGSKAATIGTARGTRTTSGSKTLRVKLTRKARSRLARFKTVRATLKLAVTDASGKTTRKQKAVSLKR